MQYNDAAKFLSEKEDELKQIETELSALTMRYISGQISERVYSELIEEYNRQLYLKPVIEALNKQSEQISMLLTRGVQSEFIYEPLYLDWYGEKGSTDRSTHAILLALCSICACVPVFAFDSEHSITGLLRSYPGYFPKMFRSRICILVFYEIILVFTSDVIQYISLGCRHGFEWLSLNDAVKGLPETTASISMLPLLTEHPIAIEVFFLLQLLLAVSAILACTFLLVTISLYSSNVVQALLMAVLTVLCPMLLGMIGFLPARFYGPYPFFSTEEAVITGKPSVFICMAIIALLSLYLYRRKRKIEGGSE